MTYDNMIPTIAITFRTAITLHNTMSFW